MSNNKTKEEFLSKTNKYNIPGWTDEELNEEFKKTLDEGIGNDLEDAIKHSIGTCPICGKPYVLDYGCDICGYNDSLYFGKTIAYEDWLQAFKDYYTRRTEQIENYIDCFDSHWDL